MLLQEKLYGENTGMKLKKVCEQKSFPDQQIFTGQENFTLQTPFHFNYKIILRTHFPSAQA